MVHTDMKNWKNMWKIVLPEKSWKSNVIFGEQKSHGKNFFEKEIATTFLL